MNHGGKREGAGRKPSPSGRSIQRSIRISRELDEYLAQVGSGVLEDTVRKTKAFREWLQKRQTG